MLVCRVPGSDLAIDFTQARQTTMGRKLRKSGIAGVEPNTMAAAAALIEAYEITSFADIGANIGIYSLVLRAIFGHRLAVDAFEPLPSLNAIMKRVAAYNQLAIKVHGAALSDFNGKAVFYVSAQSDLSNSLNEHFRPVKDKIEVDVVKFDTFSRGKSISPRLLKIDTESTEPSVLSGAREFIATVRPWIICEVLKGRAEEEITELMSPFGYSFYHLTGAPLGSAQPLSGDETCLHRNWLLAPSPPSDLFHRRYDAWCETFKGRR